MKETIKISSKIIIAVVFIFSGFVKCVDPTGFSIKLEEYLVVFGMNFLTPLSLTLSILMCGAEMLVGIMLLLNLKMKWAIWIAVALMVFYTPLTLWLAITNKVTDCGCFGDAIVLTNWETFLKNAVLDVILVFLVLNRNNYKNPLKPIVQVFASVFFTILIAGFEFFNLNHLPVIDFMPYKIGANIPKGMVVPPGAVKDSFEVVLSYQKDGKVRKFNQNNYPRTDSTWKFVDSETKWIIKGDVAPMKDFSILSPDGQDFTDVILTEPGFSLLVIFQSLKDANLKNIKDINRLVDQAISKGYKVYGLTASSPEEFEIFKEKAKASYTIYNMDGTTLKTMIRSNPGIMLIKAGTIIGKWHHKQFRKLNDI
jgi:uncharacterized membrane protein YphA (DoxX/SURF4 family)